MVMEKNSENSTCAKQGNLKENDNKKENSYTTSGKRQLKYLEHIMKKGRVGKRNTHRAY